MPVSLEPVDVPESETTPVEEPHISENVETPPDVVEEPPVAIESESKPILPGPNKRGPPKEGSTKGTQHTKGGT